MRTVPPHRFATTPEEGKAMVVFMRPSEFGEEIQSAIFEILESGPSLIGILGVKEKVAFQLDPGKHLFMVAGSNADFLPAELLANKRYYVLITPTMGRWIGRFSIYPIPLNEIYTPHFLKQLEGCKSVEKTAVADEWASSNMADIQSKYDAYYPQWRSRSDNERPRLLPRDGK